MVPLFPGPTETTLTATSPRPRPNLLPPAPQLPPLQPVLLNAVQ